MDKRRKKSRVNSFKIKKKTTEKDQTERPNPMNSLNSPFKLWNTEIQQQTQKNKRKIAFPTNFLQPRSLGRGFPVLPNRLDDVLNVSRHMWMLFLLFCCFYGIVSELLLSWIKTHVDLPEYLLGACCKLLGIARNCIYCI